MDSSDRFVKLLTKFVMELEETFPETGETLRLCLLPHGDLTPRSQDCYKFGGTNASAWLGLASVTHLIYCRQPSIEAKSSPG